MIPAGYLAYKGEMNLFLAGIAGSLALLGYFIGHNEALIKEYLRLILAGLMVFIVVLVALYVRLKLRPRIV